MITLRRELVMIIFSGFSIGLEKVPLLNVYQTVEVME
jgi:hypothetical protein